jgi:hypothetical protein
LDRFICIYYEANKKNLLKRLHEHYVMLALGKGEVSQTTLQEALLRMRTEFGTDKNTL